MAELERGAHRLQARHVHVDRTRTEIVAARQRQPDVAAAREQRSEHVDRGPDPLDELVGRDRRRGRRCWSGPADRVGSGGRSYTDRGEQFGHDRRRRRCRARWPARTTPSARSVAAISFSTEFLAPGTTTSPASGPAWRTVMQQGSPVGRARMQRCTGLPVCSLRARGRSNGHARRGPTSRACAPAWSARATTSCSSEPVAGDGAFRPASTGRFSEYERRLGRWTATSSRPPATASRSRGSAGCSRSRPRARRAPVAPAAPPGVPHANAVVGAARPADAAPGRWCSACSPRRRCRRRSSTRCSPRPCNFAADDFGVDNSGVSVAGAVVRAGIVIALPLAVLADRIGRRRIIASSPGRHRSSPRSARSRRPFRRLVATQAVGRPLGPRPRLPRRRRRRRGDAAQQPRLRRQRARHGERARRRARRHRAAARRHRASRLAARLRRHARLARRRRRHLPAAAGDRRVTTRPHAITPAASTGAASRCSPTVAVAGNFFVAPASFFQNRYLQRRARVRRGARSRCSRSPPRRRPRSAWSSAGGSPTSAAGAT